MWHLHDYLPGYKLVELTFFFTECSLHNADHKIIILPVEKNGQS